MRRIVLLVALVAALIPMAGTAVSAAEELPYYFPPGLLQSTDPVVQLAEYRRIFVAMENCYYPPDKQALILSSDSIRVETDMVSTASITKNPTQMIIVLDNHVRTPEGIRVTTLCGNRMISERELKVAIKDLERQTELAAERNHEFYGEIREDAIKALAEHLELSVEEVKTSLSEKVPGFDVTFEEFWYLPKPMKRSDFVPRELHLGMTPKFPRGILGVTWLNTGVVYYSPVARVIDHSKSFSAVLQHEMVHANVNLQRFPISSSFNHELIASLPEALYPENRIDFFFHGYMEPFRELAETYFSFDFVVAWENIAEFDFGGNLAVNEEAARKYFEQLELVKTEFRSISKQAISELYSNMFWWMAMNDLRRDGDSVFRMIVANHYDPTILGGREATMKWLTINEKKICEISRKSLNEQRDEKEGDVSVNSTLQPLYERLFTKEEREALEAYFMKHPEELARFSEHPQLFIDFLKSWDPNRTTTGGAQ